jgi:phosphatidate cytidylyltransferase
VLRHRLLVGTLLIAAFAGLCWLDAIHAASAPSGAWLFPVALLLSVLASGEVSNLVSAGECQPNRWLIFAGNFLIVAANGVPAFGPESLTHALGGNFFWPLAALAVAVLAAFTVEIVRYRAQSGAFVRLAGTIFSFAYVGLLLTFVVQLTFGPGGQGLLALLSLIVVVKMADTGAYTVGRLIGRHKMTPHLSPGKTWEGAVGAMLFAILGSWLVFNLLRPRMLPDAAAGPLIRQWIAYGLIVGIAGMLGDLAESLLKREAGRKDSSTWMPGLGGVLDVLDSILFAAPVAYFCWATGLVR